MENLPFLEILIITEQSLAKHGHDQSLFVRSFVTTAFKRGKNCLIGLKSKVQNFALKFKTCSPLVPHRANPDFQIFFNFKTFNMVTTILLPRSKSNDLMNYSQKRVVIPY